MMMKQHRRRKLCLLFTCAVLIFNGWRAQAADPLADKGNTEKVVDAYITVMTMAYPPAGGALAAAKGMMSMFGFFSKPDAVGEAIKSINQRLDVIDARIDTLNAELKDTRNQVFINANLENTRELRRYHDDIAQVVLGLSDKPTDIATKKQLVLKAQQICNGILEDQKLWIWSDLVLKDHNWNGKQIKAGTMLDPDFKPMPTLEVYAAALTTWMTAIEYAGGGNKFYVKQTFTKELQRHIDFLSVRPNWNELSDPPQTLPEEIKSRVTGFYVPTSRYPDADRVVNIAEYTRDDMGREIKPVGHLTYTAGSRNELATVPANLLNHSTPAEQDLENNYGLTVIQTLAQKLTDLRTRGTIREQYIGTFTPTYTANQILYYVKPDGTLWWEQDDIGTAYTGGPVKVSRKLSDAKQVGNGWNDVLDILPGGASTFYALLKNGDLNWYSHDDYLNGGTKWRGPIKVGTGWTMFTKVIPMGDGVLYGMLPDGTLRWYKHTNYKTGQGLYAGWEPPLTVSSGWNKFKTVFGGGGGVFYAVTQEGKLLWFRHDYLNPLAMPAKGNSMVDFARMTSWLKTWKGPKEIGTGWGDFTKLFCAGDGDIYGVLPTGELRGYKHQGWEDGSPTWGNDITMTNGWNEYLFTFASMSSHSAQADMVVK